MAKDNKDIVSENELDASERVKKEAEKSAKQISSMEISAEPKLRIEELLSAAKEVAAGIIEDAKNEARAIRGGNAHAPVMSEDVKASIERGEELCEVRLFRDNGKYSDDVYVSVNGENCIIKRGETVKIKRKFKEALDNSYAQDAVASDMQKELSEEYEKKTKEFG